MAEGVSRRIGRHIARVRNARNLTQAQLAGLADVERTYLSKVETGNYPNVGVETLETICLALNTTLKEFFESLPGA